VFEVPLTFAVNCCVVKSGTLAVFGETLTATSDAAVMVTIAEPDALCEPLAWEVAITFTCAGEGIEAGAEYSPVCEMFPLPAPPATLQDTTVFVVPETVALNCCVLFTDTFALVGTTVTEMAGGLLAIAQPITAALTHANAQVAIRGRMNIQVPGAGCSFSKLVFAPRSKFVELCFELDYEGSRKGCGSDASVSKRIRRR
jgi:hypothetical protein